MAILFFDSSGLVKRYISETGTAWVQSLNAPSAGHDLVIAEITGVEMVAAVTRRLRRGDITPADASVAISDIAVDFETGYFRIGVSLERVREAMSLAQVYGLRGYDAVQLATALLLQTQCRAFNQADPVFVTADKELATAASAAGLAVEDPNLHL